MKVTRGDLRDVYVEDGRAAVFVKEQVVVLSEIATVILESVPAGCSVSLDDLSAAVVAVVGSPAPPLVPQDLVAQHALDLVAHHVLALDEPDSDAEVTRAGVEALRDCVRSVLARDSTAWQLPEGVSGAELLAAAARHRVTPTLARWADHLVLPMEADARLRAAAGQERATVEVLAADLTRALALLAGAGARCLTFKGLALAVQAHGDVGARGTGDLDLLVHPEDLVAAINALRAGGWHPPTTAPAPGPTWAWRHLVRTGSEIALTGPTSTIDLHWQFSRARSTSPAFDILWERSVEFDVGANVVRTLAPYDALAHSASHAAKDGWHWLRGLVDVHLLMSDPGTWTGADRPLRRDELLTVGLAARMFGVPPAAPPVVHDAVSAASAVWESVLGRQSSGSTTHRPTRVPGMAFVRGLRGLRWAGADNADLMRHLSHSLMPVWLTAEEASPHAPVVVPRVLARRTVAFARRALAGVQHRT